MNKKRRDAITPGTFQSKLQAPVIALGHRSVAIGGRASEIGRAEGRLLLASGAELVVISVVSAIWPRVLATH